MKSIKGSLKEKIAILRLKKGDTEAFGYLYDLYIERIFRYVYFRISDRSIAYDITQDVFLGTWEYIVEGRHINNMQALLYRIAYHKIADFFRDKSRQIQLIEDVEPHQMQTSKMDDTELEMHFVQEKLGKLKPEYQDVLLLKHVEGLNVKEIADILEKDINNVRVLIHRAVSALKNLYK